MRRLKRWKCWLRGAIAETRGVAVPLEILPRRYRRKEHFAPRVGAFTVGNAGRGLRLVVGVVGVGKANDLTIYLR